MSAKHSMTGSDAGSSIGSGPGLFSALLEGVGASSEESEMDIDVDSASNHPIVNGKTCTPVKETSLGGDIGLATSPNGCESQLCLDTSNSQLTTEAVGAISESGVMVDALSGEDCHGSHDAPATASTRLHSSVSITLETMAKTPVHENETYVSSLCDDASLGISHPSSHIAETPLGPRKD